MLPTLPMPPWQPLLEEWVMGEMLEAPLDTTLAACSDRVCPLAGF